MKTKITNIHKFSLFMLYTLVHNFETIAVPSCKLDSGLVGLSNRANLIDIIEKMDQKAIEESYWMIFKIDSTISRSIPSINPVSPSASPYYTSLFGKRIHPVTGEIKQHNGIDIATRLSFHYIHSTADGVVGQVAFSTSAGIFVTINHLAGYSTTYMHLAGVDVQAGEKIKIGQTIGWMGSSGRATAKHVHYEIKKKGKVVNPLPYLDLYYRCIQTIPSEKER